MERREVRGKNKRGFPVRFCGFLLKVNRERERGGEKCRSDEFFFF